MEYGHFWVLKLYQQMLRSAMKLNVWNIRMSCTQISNMLATFTIYFKTTYMNSFLLLYCILESQHRYCVKRLHSVFAQPFLMDCPIKKWDLIPNFAESFSFLNTVSIVPKRASPDCLGRKFNQTQRLSDVNQFYHCNIEMYRSFDFLNLWFNKVLGT